MNGSSASDAVLQILKPYLGGRCEFVWDPGRLARDLFAQGELELWRQAFRVADPATGSDFCLLDGAAVVAELRGDRLRLSFRVNEAEQEKKEGELLRLVATIQQLLRSGVGVERSDAGAEAQVAVDVKMVRRDNRWFLVPEKVGLSRGLLDDFVLFVLLLPADGAGFAVPADLLGQLAQIADAEPSPEQMADVLNCLYAYRILGEPHISVNWMLPDVEVTFPAQVDQEELLAQRMDRRFFQAVAAMAGLELNARSGAELLELPPEQYTNAGRYNQVFQLSFRFRDTTTQTPVGSEAAIRADAVEIDQSTRVTPLAPDLPDEPCRMQEFLWDSLGPSIFEGEGADGAGNLDALNALLQELGVTPAGLAREFPLRAKFWVLLREKLTTLQAEVNERASKLEQELSGGIAQLSGAVEGELAAARQTMGDCVGDCLQSIRGAWAQLVQDREQELTAAVTGAEGRFQACADELRQAVAQAPGLAELEEAGKRFQQELGDKLAAPLATLETVADDLREKTETLAGGLREQFAQSIHTLAAVREEALRQLGEALGGPDTDAALQAAADAREGFLGKLQQETDAVLGALDEKVTALNAGIEEKRGQLLAGMQDLAALEPLAHAGELFEETLKRTDEQAAQLEDALEADRRQADALQQTMTEVEESLAGVRDTQRETVSRLVEELTADAQALQESLSATVDDARNRLAEAFGDADDGAAAQLRRSFDDMMTRLEEKLEQGMESWLDEEAESQKSQLPALRGAFRELCAAELENAVSADAVKEAVTQVLRDGLKQGLQWGGDFIGLAADGSPEEADPPTLQHWLFASLKYVFPNEPLALEKWDGGLIDQPVKHKAWKHGGGWGSNWKLLRDRMLRTYYKVKKPEEAVQIIYFCWSVVLYADAFAKRDQALRVFLDLIDGFGEGDDRKIMAPYYEQKKRHVEIGKRFIAAPPPKQSPDA